MPRSRAASSRLSKELVQRVAYRCRQGGDVEAGCGRVDDGAGVSQLGGGHDRDEEVAPGSLCDHSGQSVAQRGIRPVGPGGGPGKGERLVGLGQEPAGQVLDIGFVKVGVVVEIEQVIVRWVVHPKPPQQTGPPSRPLGGQWPGGDHRPHPRTSGQLFHQGGDLFPVSGAGCLVEGINHHEPPPVRGLCADPVNILKQRVRASRPRRIRTDPPQHAGTPRRPRSERGTKDPATWDPSQGRTPLEGPHAQ